MSVDFNPISNHPNPSPKVPEQSPQKQKSFFEMWRASLMDGYLMERLSSMEYCKRKFEAEAKNQGSDVPNKESEAFKSCITECEYHKELCAWSRRN